MNVPAIFSWSRFPFKISNTLDIDHNTMTVSAQWDRGTLYKINLWRRGGKIENSMVYTEVGEGKFEIKNNSENQ